MTRPPARRAVSPRVWAFLIIPFVSLLSLNAGLYASHRLSVGQPVWPVLAVLGVVVGLSIGLAFTLIRRLEADLSVTARLAREAADLYNAAPCGYVALDEKARFLTLNDTALAWLGVPADRLVGRPFRDVIAADGRAAFDAAFVRVMRDGSARDLEFDLTRPDGRPLHVLLNAAAAPGPSGEFLHARCTFLDLTARRRSEQRLAEVASQLQAVLAAATEFAVLATDLDGRITLFNAGAQRMLGYGELEMIGRESPWAIHHREEVMALAERRSREAGRPVRAFDALVAGAQAGRHDEGDWTYVRKDGGRVEVRTVVTAVRTPDGSLTGFLFVAQDVTERNRARERLRLTMDAAHVGTWDWDPITGQAAWSENVPALLGMPANAALSLEAWRSAVEPDDAAAVLDALKGAMADPAADRHRAVYRVRGADPVRWLEHAGRILRDGAGRAVRVVGTMMDITERVAAARALEAARDEAQRANEAKSYFLAAMSHEIRTPLGGVIGMAEALARTNLNEEQRAEVATLTRAAEGLLELVNDILDLSKVEAGKLELEQIPFPLIALADEAIAVFVPAAAAKGIALRREGVGPATVRGDPGRLRQVLLNLLSNAVKFTHSGEVVLRMEEEAGLVRFTVRDTGIGIPAEKVGRIFDPFAQADQSTSRTHGGTGLGLAISSRLVERMGGRLEVRSTPGAGSAFTFCLPLPAADIPDRGPEEAAAAPAGRPLHVLVAEDNPVNQVVLTMLLKQLGCTYELAENGHEAVVKREAGCFDLVLMDLQMPVMDGLRATRLIRLAEGDGPRVPIVACTANAMQGDRNRCLAAGMDDYLTKPVRARDLSAVFGRLFGGGPPAPPEGPEADDWRGRLSGMGFDADGIERVAGSFRETVPARLAALRQAIEQADPGQARLTAHTLKGSLAVFGARDAVAAAAEIEALAAAGDLVAVAAMLEQLEAGTRRLLKALG